MRLPTTVPANYNATETKLASQPAMFTIVVCMIFILIVSAAFCFLLMKHCIFKQIFGIDFDQLRKIVNDYKLPQISVIESGLTEYSLVSAPTTVTTTTALLANKNNNLDDNRSDTSSSRKVSFQQCTNTSHQPISKAQSARLASMRRKKSVRRNPTITMHRKKSLVH